MANLDGMRKQLESKVQRVANTVADQIERELKGSVPVESGELRSSIVAAVRKVAAGQEIRAEIGVIYAWQARPEWDRMLQRLPGMIRTAWNATR
jgi:hypothetical protein